MNKDSIPSFEEFEALIAKSLSILEETKVLNSERQVIANKVKSYMESEDIDRLATSNKQSAILVPSLYPTYGSLYTEQKMAIIDWMYANHPEYLTVVHTNLPHIIMEDGFPVPMTASGYSVRILNQTTKKEPKSLSGMTVKQVPKKNKSIPSAKTLKQVLSAAPTAEEMVRLANMTLSGEEMNAERTAQYMKDTAPVDNTKPKQLTRDDKAQRKALIISRWEEGATKSSIAKEVGLSAPYIGEILKKHEQQLVREYRKALREKPKKDESDPMLSVSLDD